MNSPWGKIQNYEKFGEYDGVYLVSTAGHGGLLLPKELAIRLDILDYGEVSSKNAWYEEDCQLYVAMMALALNSFYQISDSQIKSAIISITRHNKKYLNSVNFSDYGQAGQRFREIYDSMKEELAVADRERKNKELERKMRKEKNPELIICASAISSPSDLFPYLKNMPKSILTLSGDEQIERLNKFITTAAMVHELNIMDHLSHKMVLVTTADDQNHIVLNYNPSRCPNLLSECRLLATLY